MRAMIVEDEQPSLELMKRMVEKNRQLELVGTYTDPVQALHDILRLSPDVVFADVEMPAVNGMELARKIRERDENIQVVFVTAYEKYAIEAFQVNAVNYILKPITEEDLSVTVNRLMKGYRARVSSAAENRLRIIAFGDLTVYGNSADKVVRWPTAKVRELFACFVLSKGEALEKWQLCERLWPQSPPKKAEHSLHSAINRIKNALQEADIPPALFYERGRYRMDLSGFSCDVWELETFLASNPLVNEENIASFEKILPLYQGDLLGTEDYAWCLGLRERLRSVALTGMKDIGRYFIGKKSYERAEEFLQRSVRADPFNEEAVSLLLKVYFFTGNKEKLADCYAELKAVLRKDLGIAPKAETARLYVDLLRKLQENRI